MCASSPLLQNRGVLRGQAEGVLNGGISGTVWRHGDRQRVELLKKIETPSRISRPPRVPNKRRRKKGRKKKKTKKSRKEDKNSGGKSIYIYIYIYIEKEEKKTDARRGEEGGGGELKSGITYIWDGIG